MESMHLFLQPTKKQHSKPKKSSLCIPEVADAEIACGESFTDVAKTAAKLAVNPISLLKENHLLEELTV